MAQYIGIDKERYDQGDKFLSQDRYLANYNPRDAITFNVSSPVNTGIFGPGINPFPIIPQEGDGGGGITPGGNSKFDYEFEALGGLYNPDNVALTEEEQKTLNMQKAKDAAKMAGKLGMFALNPLSFLGKRAFNQIRRDREYKQEMNAYDEMIQQRNENRTAGTGGYQAGYSRDFMEGDGSSQDESQEASSPGSSGPGGSDTMGSFAYGGRVGYRDGGLTEYEVFKLGELGYNTKGGTVLEPFGGIKVLRNILKVNNYAYGGIVGLYR